jgi:general secretion pathway protein G
MKIVPNRLCNGKTARGPLENTGFTLIELMVVVAIIAILAAIVVPNYMSNVDAANVAAAKAQINQFKTSLVSFKLQGKTKKFPTTSEGLNALVGAKIMDSIPKDPWGNDYIYRCPGTKADYEIISYGADGQAGGTETNADVESWNMQ